MAAKIDEIDGRIAGLRRMRDELARVVGCACDSLDHCTCGAAYLARGGREAAATAERPARDERGERRQHAPPHRARRRRAVVAGRAPCGPGARRPSTGAPPSPRRVSLRLRLGRPAGDPRVARAPRRVSSSAHSPTRVSVVLWFEHDLYDQLQLVDVLALAERGRVRHRARVVVDSFPGRPAFRGLGELTAEELETLWPARRAAHRRERWRRRQRCGMRSARRSPEALAGWAAARHAVAAAARAGARPPARGAAGVPDDGLSTTERTALRALAEGASTPAAAFVAAQELEQAPFLGDTWFFRALAELGRGSRRLVETRSGDELPTAASARRREALRRGARPPDAGRRARARRRGRPGRAARHRPLGRRDAYRPGCGLALGRRRTAVRGALTAQGTSTSFVASPAA